MLVLPLNKSDNKKEPPMITSDETCMERLQRVGHEPLTVFLKNGVKLNGTITELLRDGAILTRDGASQLIFAHAVATVMPQNAGVLES